MTTQRNQNMAHLLALCNKSGLQVWECKEWVFLENRGTGEQLASYDDMTLTIAFAEGYAAAVRYLSPLPSDGSPVADDDEIPF